MCKDMHVLTAYTTQNMHATVQYAGVVDMTLHTTQSAWPQVQVAATIREWRMSRHAATKGGFQSSVSSTQGLCKYTILILAGPARASRENQV